MCIWLFFTLSPLWAFTSISLKTTLRINKWNWAVACTLATKISLCCSHSNVTRRASWQLHLSPAKPVLAYPGTDCFSSQLVLATRTSFTRTRRLTEALVYSWFESTISPWQTLIMPRSGHTKRIISKTQSQFFLHAAHLGKKRLWIPTPTTSCTHHHQFLTQSLPNKRHQQLGQEASTPNKQPFSFLILVTQMSKRLA